MLSMSVQLQLVLCCTPSRRISHPVLLTLCSACVACSVAACAGHATLTLLLLEKMLSSGPARIVNIIRCVLPLRAALNQLGCKFRSCKHRTRRRLRAAVLILKVNLGCEKNERHVAKSTARASS
jgi:hypothetical protein